MTTPGPTLETARLILRPPQQSDLDAWAAFSADEVAARFIGGHQPRGGACGLEAGRVRDDQLVRVALLLGQRRTGLHPCRRVVDRAVERCPSGAEAKRGDHQARVTEHGLGLNEPLSFDEADDAIGIGMVVFATKDEEYPKRLLRKIAAATG